jgi:hypothetical protein
MNEDFCTLNYKMSTASDDDAFVIALNAKNVETKLSIRGDEMNS